MNSWLALKGSLEKIATQVQQVLLVRSDISMLQEDLATQEKLWHDAEAELNGQINSLGLRARLLGQEVAEGEHIHAEVAGLEKSLRQQLDANSAEEASYKFEEAQADLEVNRLKERVDQLKQFQSQARMQGQAEVQKARNGELAARLKAAQLQQALNLEKDKLSDTETKLKQETASWTAIVKEAANHLETLNSTADHLENQLIPKEQVEMQLASMKAQLEEETKAIVKVQEQAVAEAAECRRRWETIEDTRLAEQEKADLRRKEMLPICNSANQEFGLLEKMLADMCGGGAPAPAAAGAAVY